ncbi:hypothetical protein D3C72_1804500 [compost metagenome]
MQRRAREQQRQQHRRRAQPGQRAACLQLRVQAAFDRVDREHQPRRDRQRRRKTEARVAADQPVAEHRSVQQPCDAERPLGGLAAEPRTGGSGKTVGCRGGDAQRHAEWGGDR